MKFITPALLACTLTTGASAAEHEAPAGEVAVNSGYDWSGVYAGLGIGVADGSVTWEATGI